MSTLAIPAAAATRQVGPGQTYGKPCDAIVAAQAGDVILVDASGGYDGDTCSWSTDNLTIRGVNGRAKIDLSGVAPSGQKGIFTVSANNTTIENFELSGAAISAAAGNNGAGIRFQGLNLTLRNCFLHDNQNGILAAPATANTGTILIETTEFANNGAGDGFSHNLYIGNFAKFTLQYSYSHGARVGHLFKSRAYTTLVLYDRLTDEVGTTASYEVDIPNGGTAYVIGNLIEQSAASQNSTIITFGEEGIPAGYDTHLFVVNNTVLNDLGSGTFIADPTTTPAIVTNNIFWNGGRNCSQSSAILTTNFDSTMGDPKLYDIASYNVHLLAGSPCIDAGTPPGQNASQSLTPVHEYVHPLGEVPRVNVGTAIDIGAYEYGNSADAGILNDAGSGVGAEDTDAASGGGAETVDEGDATGREDGGSLARDAGADEPSDDSATGGAAGLPGGCGCRLSGSSTDIALGTTVAPALLFVLAARRRRREEVESEYGSEDSSRAARRGRQAIRLGRHR